MSPNGTLKKIEIKYFFNFKNLIFCLTVPESTAATEVERPLCRVPSTHPLLLLCSPEESNPISHSSGNSATPTKHSTVCGTVFQKHYF